MTAFTQTKLPNGQFLYTSAAVALSSKDATITLALRSQADGATIDDANRYFQVGIQLLTSASAALEATTGTVAVTAKSKTTPDSFQTPGGVSLVNFAVAAADVRFSGMWDTIRAVCTDVDGAGSASAYAVLYVVTSPEPLAAIVESSDLVNSATIARTFGPLTLGGKIQLPVAAAVAADVTVDDTMFHIRCDSTAAGRTVNLPAAATCAGRPLLIENAAGTNGTTIDPDGAELIAGGATKTDLDAVGDWSLIYCDGTAWRVIAEAVA